MERKAFLTQTAALAAENLLSNVKLPKPLAAGGPLVLRNASAGNRVAAVPVGTLSDDLSPYTGAWDDAHLRHLLRRTMFGVPAKQFQAAQALGSMSAVVSKLLECQDTTKVPLPAKLAAWVDAFPAYTGSQADMLNAATLEAYKIAEIENWWFDQMMQEDLSIRHKMTLLWTNHFVTGSQTVFIAGYVYQYLMTCMANALGNFRDFTSAISIDPAMLVYLNGNQNFVFGGQPFVNENYARELMELFTLGILDPKTGQPNYTEADIQNSARALTGWMPTTTAPFIGQFNPSLHDTGMKTFLGQTGNFGLTDIIDLIFQKGTPKGYTAAYWACQKIYQEFVYYVPNKSVVDAMANVMLANNFEIAPVLEALLTSAHFYDTSVMGAQIKGPVEYAGSLVREFVLSYPAFDPTEPPVVSRDPSTGLNTYGDPNPTLTILTAICNLQGQELLNPPNVKGWPGGENWLSAGAFLNREIYSYVILNNGLVNSANKWDLQFNPDTYALEVPGASTLSSRDLSLALEAGSSAFTFGPLEGGDLDTEIQGTYLNPNYQYNTVGVSQFATYLTNVPEFQLF